MEGSPLPTVGNAAKVVSRAPTARPPRADHPDAWAETAAQLRSHLLCVVSLVQERGRPTPQQGRWKGSLSLGTTFLRHSRWRSHQESLWEPARGLGTRVSARLGGRHRS